MEQLAGGAEHLVVAADRLQHVDEPVDLLQLRGVARAEVAPAGRAGNRPQGRFVEHGAGAGAQRAEPAIRRRLVRPDPDGVDRDPLVRREARRGQGIDLARGIRPVGEKHEHPVLRRAFAQALHREPDRVADRGLLAGEPEDRLGDHLRDGVEVQGERRLQVRAGAEEDEADPIAGAARGEIARHPLDRVDPRLEAHAAFHVLLAHASGEVEGEHQVAPAHRQRHRIAHPLRAGGGQHQGTPCEQRDHLPEARPRTRRAARPGQRLLEVRDPHRRARRVGRARHHPRHHERRHDGGEHPGPDELEHGAIRYGDDPAPRRPRAGVPGRDFIPARQGGGLIFVLEKTMAPIPPRRREAVHR